MNGKKPFIPKAVMAEEKIERYFAECEETNRVPTMAGLALALGFDSRETFEQKAKESKGAAGAVMRRARAQVEEATLQAAYRSGSATGAKFVLQSGFGYGEKKNAAGKKGGVIKVRITEKEKGRREKIKADPADTGTGGSPRGKDG